MNEWSHELVFVFLIWAVNIQIVLIRLGLMIFGVWHELGSGKAGVGGGGGEEADTIYVVDIVIFNGNVLGHAWHTWCKKRYQWKEDELLFTYMPHANFQIIWL